VLSQVNLGLLVLFVMFCLTEHIQDRTAFRSWLYAGPPSGDWGSYQRGCISRWESLQKSRGIIMTALPGTMALGAADGLLLSGVVPPGWPVPTKVSVEFLVLGVGAFISICLKEDTRPEVYMWPTAIGLLVCLLLVRFWPDVGPVAIDRASHITTLPGSGARAEASSVGADNLWTASTEMGSVGTFLLGLTSVAALFRRSGK
jgi:hypothetical protein